MITINNIKCFFKTFIKKHTVYQCRVKLIILYLKKKI